MKRLLFCIWLLAVSGFAAERITLTITVTNLPVTGNTLTNNGTSRYWTNALSSGTIITNITAEATNNLIQRATTNLFTALVTYPSSGNLVPGWLTATQITLLGQVSGANTATAGGEWCTLVLTTQTVTRRYPVEVPAAAYSTPAQATNVISLLVTDLSTRSTNAFSTNSSTMASYTPTNGVFRGTVSNSAAIGGNVYRLTNGVYWTPVMTGITTTNLTNYGAMIAGTNMTVNGNLQLNEANTVISLASGSGLLQYDQGTDIMTLSNAFQGIGIDLGVDAVGFFPGGAVAVEINNTDGSLTAHSNLVSRTTGLLTNTVFGGSNQFAGSVAFSLAAVATIADGNNTVAIPDGATFVSLTGSPTATWTNCAMSGTLWNGRFIILDNATGQNMTIAHQSGFDGTAARRIITNTAADVITTGRRVTLWVYNSTTSRWLLVSE